MLRCGSLNSEWVTTSLETITPRHRGLETISIHTPEIISNAARKDGATFGQVLSADRAMRWLALDRFLVQFWESRSIRPKIVHPRTEEEEERRDWVKFLLPEGMKRGIIDLAEESS